MYEIKKAILKSVLDEKESKKTLARYDAVYYDVFGEMDKENIEKFNEALRSLEKENRIIIDGDRIDLKNSDILIANDISVICDLEKEDIEFKTIECDIGHGCNILSTGIEFYGYAKDLIHGLSIVIATGVAIKEIKDAIEGFNFLFNKVKEKINKDETIYYNEDFLQVIVLEKILEHYPSLREVNLIKKVKVNLGARGLFARQNSMFSKDSLEGSPEYIEYFVFQVITDDNEFDNSIVRSEILSTGKILNFSTNNMMAGEFIQAF
ncbi:hypothetical protein JJB75_17020 [Clostridium perfringens]|uniref:Uncharacterized protein n=2 Tax=Clostridium perfringens TaxID=1502 RepID=A0AAE8FU20_CLOPF|nr:hypothetical protein [Clostridium perfringens]MBO3304758.1 hypothetical protein [Clostridium perfringens]MBO3308085.1 hypothetical protein [Clostridium perfringens]MBO3311414.1 hypothetical protein [Clostridium perfringens]MBO3317759.1 hypothetical protein [Clostridium perfringens]MBO3392857.1 hypothetical protein [Clostridium perfringens]